jgi:methyl-accepting chemotaxis protein
VPFFGESQLRYIRYAALLLTALLVCYALARYLSSPIQKIRRATQKLAEGELTTRVGDKVGNRRDELAVLAKDFDVMAERIESLITSQQRLSRDVSHELRSPLARMNVALESATTALPPRQSPTRKSGRNPSLLIIAASRNESQSRSSAAIIRFFTLLPSLPPAALVS